MINVFRELFSRNQCLSRISHLKWFPLKCSSIASTRIIQPSGRFDCDDSSILWKASIDCFMKRTKSNLFWFPILVSPLHLAFLTKKHELWTIKYKKAVHMKKELFTDFKYLVVDIFEFVSSIIKSNRPVWIIENLISNIIFIDCKSVHVVTIPSEISDCVSGLGQNQSVMLVTIFGYWWQNLDFGDNFRMLVTELRFWCHLWIWVTMFECWWQN